MSGTGMSGATGSDSPRPAPAGRDADGRTLIFLHVPKTAGTTLNRIIEAQYNPLRIYSIPGSRRVWSIEKFKRLPESRRRRIQVLKGHMEFGLHRYLPQPAAYLTMLRQPVAQVTSSYYYGLSSRFHPLHDVLNSRRMTIEQYVELAQWANNLQTKLIGGVPMASVNPPAALAAARRGEVVPPERFAGVHCTREIYEAARHNLERAFSVVGLTERFEESLALMMIAFGWKVPFYQRFRETRQRPPSRPSASAVAFIEQHNAFDLELYECGRRLFADALARNQARVEEIRHALREGSRPGWLGMRFHAGLGWGRFATSLVRSAL